MHWFVSSYILIVFCPAVTSDSVLVEIKSDLFYVTQSSYDKAKPIAQDATLSFLSLGSIHGG